MAEMDVDSRGLLTPSRTIGPGHYGTLGVHQSTSNRVIMEAYDTLEERAIQELTYDEPTAQQQAAKEARLEELRSAARILNDSRTRRLYDRELRGEKVDWDHWAAKARDAHRGYQELDSERPQVRYPNTWIAAIDGRDWPTPSPRVGSPFIRRRCLPNSSKRGMSRRPSSAHKSSNNLSSFPNTGRPSHRPFPAYQSPGSPSNPPQPHGPAHHPTRGSPVRSGQMKRFD